MTKKEKDLWLEAIGKLRKHYKQFSLAEIPPSHRRSTGKQCPLCGVDRKAGGSICEFCLWPKFEGDTCGNKKWYRDTAQQRLGRLGRWEKRIEAEK